jgi:hypothetical protein
MSHLTFLGSSLPDCQTGIGFIATSKIAYKDLNICTQLPVGGVANNQT